MPTDQSPRFDTPPQSVCILRLSAIGDTCHAAATLRALQKAWPTTRFTWIIGKLESSLMSAILPNVEFITFEKRAMTRELLRLRGVLKERRFDLLLDLQLSIRASLVSTFVSSPAKLGFDRARARELQWLFTNRQVAPAASQHVLDSFLGFVRACGIDPGAAAWDITLPPPALDYAARLIPDGRGTLIISPCSSHPARNWSAWRYAAVADHAVTVHGMRVILVGGRSEEERRMGAMIAATAGADPKKMSSIVNQIGKDTLPELLGLLSKATVLVSPDSGPVHMATMVGLPVIGLYAATRTARAGPYYSRQWCVDKYDDAARKVFGRPSEDLPWTKKIERPGVMDLIDVQEVTDQLDALIAQAKIRYYGAMENAIKVPISPGELLDKLTILRIKSQRMIDPQKLHNVRLELEALQGTWSNSAFAGFDIEADVHALMTVNERLWVIEDDIRDKERAQTFDAEFIRLARAVYVENDERAAIKRRINAKLGSTIVEEKSYRPY